ncbi:hypothetical protein [Streptomyces sp. CA-106131]
MSGTEDACSSERELQGESDEPDGEDEESFEGEEPSGYVPL